MYVKMKPVCDCGYIFDKLKAGYESNADNFLFPNNQLLLLRQFQVCPNTCPNCGKHIEGIMEQHGDNGLDYDTDKWPEYDS